jgi:hypothetical protein
MNLNFSPKTWLRAAQEMQEQEAGEEYVYETGRSFRPVLEYETAPESNLSPEMQFFNYPGANESGCAPARRSQGDTMDFMADWLM